MYSWTRGAMASAPDSSPGGCPFKSGRVHFLHSPLLLQTLRLTQQFLDTTQFSVLLFYFIYLQWQSHGTTL